MSRRFKRRKSVNAQTRTAVKVTGGGAAEAVSEIETQLQTPEVAKNIQSTVHSRHHLSKVASRFFITGGLLGAFVAVLGASALQGFFRWYDRPKLEIWHSAMVLALAGGQQRNEVRDYATLLDVPENCIIYNYAVSGDKSDVDLWNFPSEVLFKVLLRNTGRSAVNAIRFTINNVNSGDWIGAETSPGLDVDITKSGPAGAESRIVTIRTIPAGIEGFLTIKLRNRGVRLKVTEHADRTDFFWKDMGPPYLLLFSGSKELGQRAQIAQSNGAGILQREAEFYRETALRIPFPDDSKLTLIAGKPTKWRIGKLPPGGTGCRLPSDVMKDSRILIPVSEGGS